ncbi:MAG: hypothetical protein ACKO27_00365 [Ilumatobacteraceae bacterium]
MIRLGSLAGYPFEGPRTLAGWTAPACAAVYAVLTRNDPERKPQEYSVIFVGHADDLSAERFPFKHSFAPDWIKRAGTKWNLQICIYEVPGGLRSHREQIARELISVYKPSCNPEQFDATWKAEWIGSYSAPTTGPLTTSESPPDRQGDRPG